MSLDTRVPGDPEAYAAAASWLRDSLGGGDRALADDVVDARAILGQGWSGQAEAAFHGRVTELVRAADGVADLTLRTAEELDGLGRALYAAQTSMSGLRAEAAAAGITLTEEAIGSGPYDAEFLDPELHTAWVAIEESHGRILAVWHAALERAAAAISDQGLMLADIVNSLMVAAYSVPLESRIARVMAGAARTYAADAARHARWAQETGEVIRDSGLPADDGHYDRLMELSWEAVTATEDAQAEADTPRLPRGLGVGIGVIDSVMTPLSVMSDMESGESAQQAVVSQGTAWGMGTAAGAGGTWLVTTAGGPVGLAIAGGVVLGTGASWVTDGLVDKAYGEDDPTAEDRAREWGRRREQVEDKRAEREAAIHDYLTHGESRASSGASSPWQRVEP